MERQEFRCPARRSVRMVQQVSAHETVDGSVGIHLYPALLRVANDFGIELLLDVRVHEAAGFLFAGERIEEIGGYVEHRLRILGQRKGPIAAHAHSPRVALVQKRPIHEPLPFVWRPVVQVVAFQPVEAGIPGQGWGQASPFHVGPVTDLQARQPIAPGSPGLNRQLVHRLDAVEHAPAASAHDGDALRRDPQHRGLVANLGFGEKLVLLWAQPSRIVPFLHRSKPAWNCGSLTRQVPPQ